MASLDDVVTAANNINKNLSQLIQALNSTLLTVGANPSASVGLSAVNGSATTFMRSDAAPALDQTIAPTWTGKNTFNNAVTQLGSSSALQWSTDLILTRSAAATLQIGAADAAAPVAQTIIGQSVVAGTSNTAGANLTIGGSKGTGSAAGGSLVFQVAPAGSSGTTQNSLTAALTIASTKAVSAVGSITAQSGTAIPAGGTAGAGLLVSATANFGIFFGSGTPTITAAQGSLYINSAASTTTSRLWVNTTGSNTWTYFTSNA